MATHSDDTVTATPSPPRAEVRPRGRRRLGYQRDAGDPLWYKDAIIYEVHVRAFMDSNADGIGDFRGLTQRLGYLQDLGVSAVWLLPFYPSPLRDDGYDIADYYTINPMYGTLADFRKFLHEAHKRNLRVITELVVNHTSDQHPWFQKSRRSPPGSKWRDFYVWSDTPDRYREARIIFRDFEPSNWTWDPVARAYFWHRFYSHQPDLNYDNAMVHRELVRALDFWFDMGVDGMRLDAVPYLYEREGTSCENLPETHQFLKHLRQHVDEKYGDRMLLAEANQWPEEAITYLGQGRGDECHMAFHFPLMPRLFMALRMEDRVPITDILEQTPPLPETSQWALFLRNHDELTLEMVTDEERDYMYRVYANDAKARINLGIRRRLAPLVGSDRKRIELLYLLLFCLPGSPVLYYGDEIGMGDNIYLGDRNGVRTPMQWSSDKNAGFSRASPQALYFPIILAPEYHYEAINVEAQQRNPHSLLWWIKRTLTLRKRYKAFGRGRFEIVGASNRKVLAFLRRYESETLLVVVNLSRFSQPVSLALHAYKGLVPVELFGRTRFPLIEETSYPLTLGPHTAFCFSLEARDGGGPVDIPDAPQAAGFLAASTGLETPEDPRRAAELPTTDRTRRAGLIEIAEGWEEFLEPSKKGALEKCLAEYLSERKWEREVRAGPAPGRDVKNVVVRDAIALPFDSERACLVVAAVEYLEGDPDEYLLPVNLATGARQRRVEEECPAAIIARLRIQSPAQEGVLYEAVDDPDINRALIEAIARRRTFDSSGGQLKPQVWTKLRLSHMDRAPENGGTHPVPLSATAEQQSGKLSGETLRTLGLSACELEEHTTTSVFADRYLLKLFRRVYPGVNPDLEVSRFLNEHGFGHTPQVLGALHYHRADEVTFTAGLLRAFVPSAQSAFTYMADVLGRYFDRVRTVPPESRPQPAAEASLVTMTQMTPSDAIVGLIGTPLELARLLGQRTGQLHLALASNPEHPDFAPEPFTPFYQRALYQSFRNGAVQALQLLRHKIGQAPAAQPPSSPGSLMGHAQRVAAMEESLLRRLRAVHECRIVARRIRCHGNYHLGNVLYTGKDFVVINFEGDPSRPLGERRIKGPALRDIASMIRSFDYSARTALWRQFQIGNVEEHQLAQFQPWAGFWHRWVSSSFLKAYLKEVAGTELVPADPVQLSVLLDATLLSRAFYELAFELTHRPSWQNILLRGVIEWLEAGGEK